MTFTRQSQNPPLTAPRRGADKAGRTLMVGYSFVDGTGRFVDSMRSGNQKGRLFPCVITA